MAQICNKLIVSLIYWLPGIYILIADEYFHSSFRLPASLKCRGQGVLCSPLLVTAGIFIAGT